MTRIYYYISPSGNNPVNEFLDSLAEKYQRKIGRTLAHIREYGLGIHIDNVKKLKLLKYG